MRKLIYIAICISLMVGFWHLIRYFIVGIDPMFGHGFAAGTAFFVLVFWYCEKIGALRVVDPNKGTWVPRD